MVLLTPGASTLLADFGYKVTKRITGGTVIGTLKKYSPGELNQFFGEIDITADLRFRTVGSRSGTRTACL
jgi:hypothetical protein